ncbi:von Willebrand factor type A domain-containing protein [Murinocardiopsis flavida]|uniref:von Willebrand factor type A domain-containing protein n=1 Tax=Murinocardiopsis flavida TaxID=645275 RepID=A0A2P8DGE6_9ACTN|nr:VWA domain-containing protein [Murinocardiopsis flavida]PSK96295.1 von Willebrand factor type A domain-containing protein [Murinocardiopsis flavida]
MSDLPAFTVHVDQNRHLPLGSREVHAVVSVEASGGSGGAAAHAQAAEVIIIDASGSMHGAKIAAAKRAAKAAVDALRDGVHFAIVAGTDTTQMIYPPQEQLVEVSAATREDAKAAIGRLDAYGGTTMGPWLNLAARMFEPFPQAIKHAILLTDGQNHELTSTFDRTLAYCAGRFVCDCRGVGTDWNVEEVRKISSALLGTVDILKPEEMEDDFRAMAEAAMGKAVADVALRVWTPQNATLRFVKQVAPTVEDLTAKRTESGAQAGDYPTGSWGDEARDYHICVEVPAGDPGREMRAGWVKLVAGGAAETVLATGNILAEWTDDEAKSTQLNPRVAHYTGQVELAAAIQEGLRARDNNDEHTATARLGRAMQLAEESGNEGTARLLRKVVEVDKESGTARLKRNVDKEDEMSLNTRSTRTVGIGGRRAAGPGNNAG